MPKYRCTVSTKATLNIVVDAESEAEAEETIYILFDSDEADFDVVEEEIIGIDVEEADADKYESTSDLDIEEPIPPKKDESEELPH
jgi:hypothetical protein